MHSRPSRSIDRVFSGFNQAMALLVTIVLTMSLPLASSANPAAPPARPGKPSLFHLYSLPKIFPDRQRI